MNNLKKITKTGALALVVLGFAACKKDDKGSGQAPAQKLTITVENVLKSKPLVESGTFQGTGTPALILPGQSVDIQFSAAKGQAITFATMYGWSNDMFFAPANPGIKVYDTNGNPIEGDVSSQIKLWDNGTRVNQHPGAAVNHPGTAEAKNITEVNGTDAQGNTYLPASSLVNAKLKYNGNSTFTLTLKNISGGTPNETPLSPGAWAISYIVGTDPLNATPVYNAGAPTPANGLTNIAEMGDNTALSAFLASQTGIFTPLSPILVVVYNGIDNPIYKLGDNDAAHGLKNLAQQGNADTLAGYLKGKPGIKAVYVLPAPGSKVLLPVIGAQAGSMVQQAISVSKGDRLAIATMYGYSNDWFFASADNGVDATVAGDISSTIKLFDDGTAINQFPGAGLTQFNLAGTPLQESKPVALVPNPNGFTTLPAITDIISVKLVNQ